MRDDSPSAYEVLGVRPDAGHEEIRLAYRRLLRETHPDLGGSSERFNAVQRAWASLATPDLRRAYDQGLGRPVRQPGARAHGAARGPAPRVGSHARTTPPRAPQDPVLHRARSYGHPGGVARERFFALLREWAGRGAAVENPYDPGLLLSAPPEIRQLLAKAQAEEATATVVSGLGPDFAIWNDVSDGAGGIVDHVVVGPAGAYVLSSEDWGAEVSVVRGEIECARLEPGETPVRWFQRRVKLLARRAGVRFSGLIVVVPDGALARPMVLADRHKSGSTVVLRRENLAVVLTSGAPERGIAIPRGWTRDSLYETRERLQSRLELV